MRQADGETWFYGPCRVQSYDSRFMVVVRVEQVVARDYIGKKGSVHEGSSCYGQVVSDRIYCTPMLQFLLSLLSK